ncbi:sensor histidine kinase [Acidipila rosea]|uniref:histidine kinase n=1 Tax=Acidipila rosea TaxID=768535 RepID=A0A4R1LCC2_9BACT|nr:ATP-binding protein [Acidipila rosea]TCK75237.1 PAS domain S-box-containing protein [Acidipila rosea]
MTQRGRAAGRHAGKRPGTGFAFEARIKLLLLLLCLPALVLLWLLLWIERVPLLGLVGSLVAAALLLAILSVALFEQFVRPLQTLANVVASLREQDYSFRARGAARGDSLGELAAEINALADTLQGQRVSALEATALLRRVIEELDAPVVAFDQQLRLRLVNPAAERVLGLSSESDLGRGVAELKVAPLLADTAEQVITLDSARWMVRRTTFRQRGVPHTLLLLSDVSSALREEERVAWRRLIRVLGHEISNSLAPIKSIAGSLRSRLPADGGDLERGLGVIEARAESLNRFVQAYRQLAQLPQPVLRRVAVRPLLEQAARLETRIAVEVGEAPEVELLADPDQMEQLLINLVRNGVEAAMMPREEHASAEARVTVRCLVEEGMAVIEIIDNGPGFANASNLFVPFYTTKKSGSGVGLVLARQIAEGHQGTVELRNRTDASGCVAEVRIPLAE